MKKKTDKKINLNSFWEENYSPSNVYNDLRKRENRIFRDAVLIILIIIFVLLAWAGLYVGTGTNYSAPQVPQYAECTPQLTGKSCL